MPPTRFWAASAGRAFVGRLETGSDLVQEIERFCAEQGITAAQVTVIGAHATFAAADGATVGGHLLRGCEVFAGEVMIRELGDVSLVRLHDEETGLALW